MQDNSNDISSVVGKVEQNLNFGQIIFVRCSICANTKYRIRHLKGIAVYSKAYLTPTFALNISQLIGSKAPG